MLVFLCRLIYNAFIMPIFSTHAPRAGSGVVRMDPLRFLAGCRTGLVCLSYLSKLYYCIVVY